MFQWLLHFHIKILIINCKNLWCKCNCLFIYLFHMEIMSDYLQDDEFQSNFFFFLIKIRIILILWQNTWKSMKIDFFGWIFLRKVNFFMFWNNLQCWKKELKVYDVLYFLFCVFCFLVTKNNFERCWKKEKRGRGHLVLYV